MTTESVFGASDRAKVKLGAYDTPRLVWLVGDKGELFTATVYNNWLGPDRVMAGDHKGRVWLPI